MQYIKITPEVKKTMLEEFKKHLDTVRCDDNTLVYRKNIGTTLKPEEKPNVLFTEQAWAKMKALVNFDNNEIGWHGLIRKNGKNYTVYDILVYPQTVTGATVTTDDVAYAQWLCELEDDVFDNMRFQGHSHVNMQTSPSMTDTTYYNGVLNNLQDTDFYVFLIINKRLETNIRIYDLENNIMYGNAEINIITPDVKEQNWASEQIQKHVKKHTYNYSYTKPTTKLGTWQDDFDDDAFFVEGNPTQQEINAILGTEEDEITASTTYFRTKNRQTNRNRRLR